MNGLSKQQRNIIRALIIWEKAGLKENQWQDFTRRLAKGEIYAGKDFAKIKILRFIATYGFKEYCSHYYPKSFFKGSDIKRPYKERNSISQSVKRLIQRGYLSGNPWYGNLGAKYYTILRANPPNRRVCSWYGNLGAKYYTMEDINQLQKIKTA